MDFTLRIQRFDPEKDAAPHLETYSVSAEPSERILDCLNRIRWEQDGTLAYRMSCGHGVCGSDAMRINGRCALACQKLVGGFQDGRITLEPLPGFRVLKDLIVDLEPFFQKVQAVRPYLVTRSAPPDNERLQDESQRAKLDEAIRCILCACCEASCPVAQENEQYLGPAALVRAFRYLFDSRDEAYVERIQGIDNPDGVWACVNHFECTRACPKEIPVTKSINTLKREIQKALGRTSLEPPGESS
jgi:succinate dehydrogenase / fumarate reductase iron-sulfur subunit